MANTRYNLNDIFSINGILGDNDRGLISARLVRDSFYSIYQEVQDDINNLNINLSLSDVLNQGNSTDGVDLNIDNSVLRFNDISQDNTLGNILVIENPSSGEVRTRDISTIISSGGGNPSGDNGEIQFNDNNNFGASSDLFWDNENKRIGIGTSTPEHTLDMHSTGSFLTNAPTIRFNKTSFVGDSSILFSNNGTLAHRIRHLFSGVLGIGGTNGQTLNIGSNLPINTLSLDNSGFVGIGLLDPNSGLSYIPSSRLEIRSQGNLSTDSVFKITNSDNTNSIFETFGNGDFRTATRLFRVGVDYTGSAVNGVFQVYSSGDNTQITQFYNSLNQSIIQFHEINNNGRLTINDTNLTKIQLQAGDSSYILDNINFGSTNTPNSKVTITAQGNTNSDNVFNIRNNANTNNLFTVLGNGEVYSNGSGNIISNTAYGSEALFSNVNGTNNTAYGYRSLTDLTSGNGNTAFGTNSGNSITNGNDNITIGYNSGNSMLSASFNVSVGRSSLLNNIDGNDNTCVGHLSGRRIENSNSNTFIGSRSGSSRAFVLFYNLPLEGNGNTALGVGSLGYLTQGNDNVAIGYNSGSNITSGSNNIFIGYETQPLSNSDNNEIVIGYNAIGLGSDTTVIGNSSTILTKLEGALRLGSINEYVDDTDAGNNGLIEGDVYHTGGVLKVKL